MNNIYVILGPTCTGKTSIALDLCKVLGGEIISADSRQIYKYMDIGTGKFPFGEHNVNIKIWGYDLVVPGRYFSVVDYFNFASKKIEEIIKSGKKVFVVGGTGFYIDVLTRRQEITGYVPNFVLREQLENKSVEELLSYLESINTNLISINTNLKSINSNRILNIDTKNKVRIIRAIEKELTKKNNGTSLVNVLNNVSFKFIGLQSDRSFLYDKVDSWVNWIWENGLIEEVKGLINDGYKDTHQMKGLIYKDVVDFLDGKTLEQETMQRTKFDLHAYIRRQQTWFKKNDQIQWFEIKDKKLSEKVKNFVLLR